MLSAVEKSDFDPVLRAYEPGGGFLGGCPIMIYKMGERGLGYYDNVLIREIMPLFPTPSTTLPHITGRPGVGEGWKSGYLTQAAVVSTILVFFLI